MNQDIASHEALIVSFYPSNANTCDKDRSTNALYREQEQKDHYNATLTGGILGGVGGLAIGGLGVYAASVRYPAFRQLTLPLRAFLITSSGTFAGKLRGLDVNSLLD